MAQTKTKLKQVSLQIVQLQKSIHQGHNKRSALSQTLAQTEKQLNDNRRALQNIQHDLALKQQSIVLLQAQIKTLTQQLNTQQQQLIVHVRARYKLGEYQPLTWILNQDNPYTLNTLITYYRYILKSDQIIIAEVQDLQTHLTQNQTLLKSEMNQKQQLAQQLIQQQQRFNINKHYHAALLDNLTKTIQNKQQTLNDYQHNKNNLSQLLKTLATQPLLQPHVPLVFMKRKLPKPVQASVLQTRKINQGVLFYADEGQAVSAVLPGKVLFSHWLKGYGLLLIIDHGRGYLSLYAHNKTLYKKTGDTVRQGEQIATVGHSGGIRENGLYFELRRQGKAIPPLQWLA